MDMDWLNGRVDGLAQDQREEVIAQQREQSRRQLSVLFMALPLLFLVDGLEDVASDTSALISSLLWRLGFSLLAVVLALTLRRKALGEDISALLAIVGIGTISVATVLSVQADPARTSFVHVVVMLLAVLLLPMAIRLGDLAAMIAVLLLPLLGLLGWHGVPFSVWATSLTTVSLGICAGIFLRRQRLEIAVELLELRHQLELRIDMDMLTGMHNREGWFRNAREVFILTRDARKPMAVVYLDLDHFKRINDDLGHAAGDHALALVADVMRRYSRRQDILGRLGGEEFVLLMPGLLEQPALRIVQDLCSAVRAIPFQRPITFSAGMCQVRASETLEDAMRRADQVLLQAKREGRDRVLRAS